jgi:hypothetical protein
MGRTGSIIFLLAGVLSLSESLWNPVVKTTHPWVWVAGIAVASFVILLGALSLWTLRIQRKRLSARAGSSA